jgi:AraC-like DNA-binding protein
MLSRVVEHHAEALLAARPEPHEAVIQRVRRHLVAALHETGAEATLSAVATKLHMSVRSLQRRLSDEGSTFDDVLEDTRRDLALRYLSDSKIAIAEVAYLLGYSEPSAFHRAFKRWTGKTPAQARAA